MAASLFVVYEQINPTDAFGAMMLRNLKVTGEASRIPQKQQQIDEIGL